MAARILTITASMVEEKGLQGRVRFQAPRNDVDFYYAAADVYAGPSLEDTFAQPPAEAWHVVCL